MNGEKLISAHTETNPVLYKNFFRTYYSEKLKTVKIFTMIIAIILFAAALYLYYSGAPLIWPGLCVWIGLLMIIYPRNTYRRPYRKMKNMRVTTYFDFYGDSMTERSGGKAESFKYSDIYKTIETNQYFYIFHTPDSASVIEKKDINHGDADGLRTLLKSNTNYKRKK